MRPLHFVAYALQWLLGNGQRVGVAAGISVLLVTRYVVARWAVSPLLSGYDRWVAATLATMLVPWPGLWLGRFGPAQLSAVFFFAPIGFSVRLFQRWSTTHFVGCTACVVLLLSTYQGLALCLLAIPLVSLLWLDIEEVSGIGLARVGFPIVLGLSIYGIYWTAVSSIIGLTGYDGTLARDTDRLLTVTGFWSHGATAYVTAFWGNKLLVPFLSLFLAFLYHNKVRKLAKSKVFDFFHGFCGHTTGSFTRPVFDLRLPCAHPRSRPSTFSCVGGFCPFVYLCFDSISKARLCSAKPG